MEEQRKGMEQAEGNLKIIMVFKQTSNNSTLPNFTYISMYC